MKVWILFNGFFEFLNGKLLNFAAELKNQCHGMPWIFKKNSMFPLIKLKIFAKI